ncbi:MAG: hypothetical protein D6725_06470 [Planctomycetota bacterium]|nr:MAG: hypothetical protein D6725_06470 [Planctomycetota bacterium]
MLRAVTESLVFLLMAVIVLRAYAVEGYIIATGSMAPHLLGRHVLLKCVACGYETAVGVGEEARGEQAWRWKCGNCGLRQRSAGAVAVSDGDQLLVAKQLPRKLLGRRWRPVVFLNPADPSVPFVKRIVGLPGETVLLREGDVWIDGRRVVKTLPEQRALRILVYDAAYAPPTGNDWQPRWIAADGVQRTASGFRWTAMGGRNGAPTNGRSQDERIRWVHYRHWIRSGGAHRTAVPLRVSSAPRIPNAVFSPVAFDEHRRVLTCRGVMPPAVRDALLAGNPDPGVRAAVRRLAELSHWAPITDTLDYNRTPRLPPRWVRDIMLTARVRVTNGHGTVLFRMTDGDHWFELALDWPRDEIRLSVDVQGRVLWSAPLERTLGAADVFRIEFSLFDRHVLAGVDGRPLFSPVAIETLEAASGSPEEASADGGGAEEHAGNAVGGPVVRPIRPAAADSGRSGPFDRPRRVIYIGVVGMECVVDELRVYRDVYYRTDGVRHGAQPLRLGIDEYFVLGDNTAVSADSRLWDRAGVPESMLIGRPLVVHLPSRTIRWRLGTWTGRFRVPEWRRVRYIR